MGFPASAYYNPRNYIIVEVDLAPSEIKELFIKGDWIDVLEINGAELDQILMALNDSDFDILLNFLGAVSPFYKITLKNTTSNTVYIKFKIGMEFFRIYKNYVVIHRDLVGFAKEDTQQTILAKTTSIDDKLSQPTNLRGANIVIDNSSGTSDLTQQLFSSSTPSKYATIINDGTDTIKIGDGTNMVDFNPSETIETNISDLSNIYITVPAGKTAKLRVIWEV